MHPSRAIRGNRSKLLTGRRIVLAVTGSIAAVEVPRIARELIRHGAEVRAVMSPDAARIITPEALHFATGSAPVLALSGEVEHVSLLGPGEGQADLLLIAPATANTISKVAHGIDDTVVTSFASVALGGGVPVLVAPAMHAHMASNPAVAENLERLRRWGVGIIASQSVEGEEKIAPPEEVAAAVLYRLARGPWAGRRVLVIGGAGREPIDAVRSVTNESSGATAVQIATQAHFRGADVESWLGAVEVSVPSFLRARRWRSVGDLTRLIADRSALPKELAAIWVPAALADYTLDPQSGKISSRDHAELVLTLRRAPKVLAELRRRAPPPTEIVGFKLEAGASEEELLRAAERMREEVGADWVVANDRASMGSAETSVWLISRDGRKASFSGPKSEVAGRLLDEVGPTLGGRPKEGPPVRRRPHGRRASRRATVPPRTGSRPHSGRRRPPRNLRRR
ncbi:MAG TPA: bifunctional phosphopantothenoylcysteine decarboxylase/phosphopantothenate--cysteine ligase CoaBC [Thermoplasmata archaeon]|nr:bifunctional phosphopantothenoylcysteine decarboxylase/phosphopantothenate--cysteine ligase CoaBC [Thermoplasmata archaeon]